MRFELDARKRTLPVWFCVFVFAACLAWIAWLVQFQDNQLAAYRPGVWRQRGDLDGLEGFLFVPVLLAAVLSCLFLARLRMTVQLAALSVLIGIGWILLNRWGDKDPLPRFQAEKVSYQAAILKKTTFGAQFTETYEGTVYTYWRWESFGIDNAIGIIYDPTDSLDRNHEERRQLFKNPSTGVIHRVRKLEPKWFFAEHS
jgi:hypothetical protein